MYINVIVDQTFDSMIKQIPTKFANVTQLAQRRQGTAPFNSTG